MEQERVQLTDDEKRIGMMLTDRARQARAEFDICCELEATYMASLQKKYGKGPDWVVMSWINGLEPRGGGGPSNG
jgi:hypothetical protein